MFAFLASLRKNRRLLKDLVRRDLHGRYVGSTMGFFWSLVFPAINLCVYMFVFRVVFKARWSDQQGPFEVGLLMLTGIMVWQAFAEGTYRMTSALVDNSNLIQKVVFPSEVLPVSLTVSSLVNMMIGIVVALLGVIWFAYVKAPAGPPPPVPVPLAFGSHVPGHGPGAEGAAPELTTARPFHCASSLDGTRYTETSVVDDGKPPWSQGFGGASGRTVLGAGWNDTVYAASGEWARVVSKRGLELEIDRWRDRSGAPVARPKDGVQALVVGRPERPLGLSVSLAVIPVLMLVQGFFMLGIGCFLATLMLYVRDTLHFIGVLLTVWMFATPIVYPERMMRDAGYGWLPEWNPMNWLVSSYREVLVYGDWPDPGRLASFSLVGFVLLLAGSAFFMFHKPRFPDLL